MVLVYEETYENTEAADKRKTERDLGAGLLLAGLQKQYGMDLRELPVIEREEHGKPFLRDYPQIHYNISHTDGMVVCAIGTVPLGVDVEKIRPIKEKLFSTVLSKEEAEQLKRMPAGQRDEGFFRFWTLKESYGKALGCGLQFPLTETAFGLEPDGKVTAHIPGFFFRQKKPGTNMILSVCAKGDTEIVFKPASRH